MKIEKNNQIINPFGGINFVVEQIRNAGIAELIDNELGKRPKQATYSYSDVFLNMWSVFFCGGDCAEDLNQHLKDYLKSTPGLHIADADTVLRVLKGLKTDKEKVITTDSKVYETSKNDQLNQLNISILKATKQLKEGQYYDFDYDNEVLRTEKYDTKKTYKMVNGYFPGMATISGMPVYIENRDGNMNVKTDQASVLTRSYKMLLNNGIKINRSRMDAGSYSQEIVSVIEKNSNLFYIRANRCDSLTNLLLEKRDWQETEINYTKYEVCSVDYKPFKGEKTYRLVVMREKTNKTQLDLFTQDNMKYRSILTNDKLSTEKEIIEYYNARGAEERTIDIMNNDFGWKQMPFSFMEENTVYLLVMMMCKNIFTWIIGKFAEVFTDLKRNFRLKKFIFRFITVPVKWIKTGGQMILKVFSNKSYELIRT